VIDDRFKNHPNINIRRFAMELLQRKLDPAKIRQFEAFANNSKRTEDEKRDSLFLLDKCREDPSLAKPAHSQFTAGKAIAAPSTTANYSNPAAPPSILGQPFHNPYTFIPFGTAPKRSSPTPLTQDEVERDRFTGIVQIDVRTLSPLLSPDAQLSREKRKSTELIRVLRAGNHPIVPASGVRGTLRTLLTVLTGGTLGYVDESLYLTQGRDAQLGPRGNTGLPTTPQECFLAEVVSPGTALVPGTVKVCRAELLTEAEVRPLLPFGCDLAKMRSSSRADERSNYRITLKDGRILKLSGRKVPTKGVQRDGVFDPKRAIEITLNPELWQAYAGRYRHSERSELKPGDIVWLEPIEPSITSIIHGDQVKSIQWARWGRQGTHLLKLLNDKHRAVFPDSMRDDGLVDEIVNLFGQISHRNHPDAPSFAGRVRPDNLVFNGTAKVQPVHLSPMLTPHPGCIAFYRNNSDPESISREDPLRGYKVYRNTKERGVGAPWLYENAPVFKGNAPIPASQSEHSRHVELIQEGEQAHVQLSVRSLNKRELALILLACSVDWKLGGGKPLGLGHSRPTRVRLVDEFGATTLDWNPDHPDLDRPVPAPLPEPYAAEVADLAPRARLYQASQRPVDRLRYPRAAAVNNHQTQRGGQIWFQRHASPKKNGPDGLERRDLGGELRTAAGRNEVLPQSLPLFSDKDPFADKLYGYDLSNDPDAPSRSPTLSSPKPAPFDPAPNPGARDPNARPAFNRELRQQSRNDRPDRS
jgi:hypothetical protein